VKIYASPRYRKTICICAAILGVLVTFTFHAAVFNGGDWETHLAIASRNMAIVATIVGLSAGTRHFLALVWLLAPFAALDAFLFILSVLSGGNPISFAYEIFLVVGAGCLGSLVGIAGNEAILRALQRNAKRRPNM
jgi:hypothetical protein